jgi:hypothetical protein
MPISSPLLPSAVHMSANYFCNIALNKKGKLISSFTLTFNHLDVDKVDPLSISPSGHVYLPRGHVYCSQRQTRPRWVQAVTIKYKEASTCRDTLIASWVARFGMPAKVTMDRGASIFM